MPAWCPRSYHVHRANYEVRCRKYRLLTVACRQIMAAKKRKKRKCGGPNDVRGQKPFVDGEQDSGVQENPVCRR